MSGSCSVANVRSLSVGAATDSAGDEITNIFGSAEVGFGLGCNVMKSWYG